MSTRLSACVAELRTRLTPEDEGSLWILFLDHAEGEVIMAAAFDRAMLHIDAEMIQSLRDMICEVPASAVLLAVPRADALPLTADKELVSCLLVSPPKSAPARRAGVISQIPGSR